MQAGRELLRKAVHIGAVLPALTLRWLSPAAALAWPVIGLVFNVLVLPRIGGRRLWRREELAAGYATGIVMYPLTVLVLVLAFWNHLEVVAAGWGLLALGDGAASLAGGAWGRHRLPWNPEKSWAGSLAYWVFGTVGAASLVLWTAPGRYPVEFVLGVCAASALVAAWLESLPERLDDNLFATLVGALLIRCLLLTEGAWSVVSESAFLGPALLGVTVNILLALVALRSGGIDRRGALAGAVLGSLIWAFLGWRGFLLLAMFFVLGTASTWLGYSRKKRLHSAQERGGKRSASNALANTGVAAVCAVLAGASSEPSLFVWAFVASMAGAAADTLESEIGIAWGGEPRLVTTLERVPPGTDGAVSMAGTAAGLAGALVVSAAAALTGLVPAVAWVPIAAAALVATLLESLVGALFERRQLLDNDAVNLSNTLFAALLGALAWALFGSL